MAYNVGLLVTVLLAAGLFSSCSWDRDVEYAKLPDGKVVRIQPDPRCTNCYKVVEVDTTYRRLFEPCR